MEMTHEIVISIEDKVSATIAPKIKAIGEASKEASPAIKELQLLLKSMNASGIKEAFANVQGMNAVIATLGKYNKEMAKAQELIKKTELLEARRIAVSQESYNKIVRANNESLQKIERARNESNSRTMRQSAKMSAYLIDQERITQSKLENVTNKRRGVTPVGRSTGGESSLLKAGAVGSVVTGIASGMDIISSIGRSTMSFVNAVKDLTTSYIDLQNKLKNVTDSQGQLNVVTNQMFDISNRTRTSVENTALIFNRFDLAMRGLGAGQMETLRLTETLNKAMIVSGASTTEQTQIIRQLSQAMSKGKLDGDEFRTVMETMPPVAKAIADTMGVAKGQLLDLAPKGKITAEVMREAFARLAIEMDITFEKTTKTIDQSLTVLKNSFIQLFGEVEKSNGAFKNIADNIYKFSMDLNELSPQLVTTTNTILNLVAALWKITPAAMILGDLKTTLSNVTSGITATSNLLERGVARVRDYMDGFKNPGAFLKAENYNLVLNEQKQLRDVEIERTDRLFKLSIINNRIKTATEEISKITDEQIKKDIKLGERKKWLNDELNKQIKNRMQLEGFDQLRQPTSPVGGGTRARTAPIKPMSYITFSDISTGISEAQRLSEVIGKDTEVEKRLFDIREKLNNQLKKARDEKRPNIALIEKELELFKDQEPFLRDRISNQIHSEMVQRAANDILKKGSDELSKYNIQEEALNKLLDMGLLSLEKYNFEFEKNTKAKENALNPLKKYTDTLEDERKLLGLTADEIEIVTKRQEAMAAGMKGKVLTDYISKLQQLQKERVGGNIISDIKNDLKDNNLIANISKLHASVKAIMEEVKKGGLTYGDVYNKFKSLGLGDVLKGSELEVKAYNDSLVTLETQIGTLREAFIELGIDSTILERNMGKLKILLESEAALSRLSTGLSSYFTDASRGLRQLVNDMASFSIGGLVGNWKGGLYEMSIALQNFTSSAIDGLSDIIGRWVWMGDSVEDVRVAVGDLARSILKDLTAQLIKNAILKLFESLLGLNKPKESDRIKQIKNETAASLASLSVITSANAIAGPLMASFWGPAAVAVSLATMGGNAPGAIAGILGAYGAFAGGGVASTATSAGGGVGGTSIGADVLQLADGGLVPGGRQLIQVNEIGQEYVMNARATSQYRPMLEAMNSGKSTPVGSVNVTIENYGTNKDFEVERLSPTEVRIIARDEIRASVPSLVSGQMTNPNSEIGKSMARNTNLQWRR